MKLIRAESSIIVQSCSTTVCMVPSRAIIGKLQFTCRPVTAQGLIGSVPSLSAFIVSDTPYHTLKSYLRLSMLEVARAHSQIRVREYESCGDETRGTCPPTIGDDDDDCSQIQFCVVTLCTKVGSRLLKGCDSFCVTLKGHRRAN